MSVDTSDLQVYEERFSNDEDFDLTDNDYIVDILAGFVISAFVSLICLCACCGFLLIEFGKVGRTKRLRSASMYGHERKLLITRIAFGFFTACLVITAALGIPFNEDVRSAFDSALSKSGQSIDEFEAEYVFVIDNVRNNYDDNSYPNIGDFNEETNTVDDFEAEMSGIEKIARDRRGEVDDAETSRKNLVIVVFVIGVVTCLCYFLISVVNNRRYMKFGLPAGFLLCVFAWLIFGTHHLLNRIADDVCFELNSIFFDDTPIISSTLTEFLDCPEVDDINQAYNATRDGVNHYLQVLASIDSSNNIILSILETYDVSSFPFPLIDSIQSALDDLPRTTANTDTLNKLDELLSNLPVLRSIYNCDAVERYFVLVQNDLCFDFIDSSYDLERVAIANALVLSSMVLLALWSLSFLKKALLNEDPVSNKPGPALEDEMLSPYRYIDEGGNDGVNLYPSNAAAPTPVANAAPEPVAAAAVSKAELQSYSPGEVDGWLSSIGANGNTRSIFTENEITGDQLLRARSDRLNALVGAEDAQKILSSLSSMN